MKNDKKFDNLQSLDPSEKKEKTKRLKILKLPLHKKIKSDFLGLEGISAAVASMF